MNSFDNLLKFLHYVFENGDHSKLNVVINEIDNLKVVKSILKILGKSEELLRFGQSRPGEDTRYSLDSTKIRKKLNWKPKINFEEGLEKTIEWYKSNKSWAKNTSKEVFGDTPWKKQD